MVTEVEKEKVLFCEMNTDAEFKGDINNENDVLSFLNEWYKYALFIVEDLKLI